MNNLLKRHSKRDCCGEFLRDDRPRFFCIPRDVSLEGTLNVPHNVPHGRDELIEFIKAQVRLNNKISRHDMAKGAGVSVKTIQRALNEIDNLQYVGSGNNGHWELDE